MTDDPVPGLAGFARALRETGVPADRHRTAAFLDAARQLDLAAPAGLYWAGRLTLCAEPHDLPRYDEMFACWFGERAAAGGAPGTPVPRTARIASLSAGESAAAETADQEPLATAASDAEVLRHRDLGTLSAAERAHLRELFAVLRPVPPRRRTARTAPARGGALDPRRTLRAMLAAGGEPVRLARRRRAYRARRVVFLIDVSGSMTPYADALLRFTHVVARSAPLGAVEVFTLGTRLTRVSRQLRQRDPDLALLAAGAAVPDFAGGTRLGETIKAFADRWGRRGVARSAVVVICSDGWERGDAALLGEQVAALRRLAHAILWVNPHAGKPGYEPVQAGIAEVLPHLDQLLAGHSLATLERLLAEIRSA